MVRNISDAHSEGIDFSLICRSRSLRYDREILPFIRLIRRFSARLVCLSAIAVGLSLPSVSAADSAEAKQAPALVSDGSVLDAKALVEVADLSGLSVSEDGAYAVIRIDQADIATNDYQLNWKVVDLRSGEIVQAFSGGAALFMPGGVLLPGEAQWLPSGEAVIVRALTKDGVQLLRHDIQRNRTDAITSNSADIERFSVRKDGSIVYAIGPTREELLAADRREFLNGTHLDGTVQLGSPIVGGAIVNGQRLTLRFGHEFGVDATLLGRVKEGTILIDNRGKALQEGVAFPEEVKSEVLSFDKDRKASTPIVSTRVVMEQLRSVERPVRQVKWGRAGQLASCDDPRCSGNVTLISWSSDGRALTFWREGDLDTVAIYALDASTGQLRTILETDEQLGTWRYDGAHCPIAGVQLVCVSAGAAQPPRLITINLENGIKKVILDPNERLASQLDVKVERIEWTSTLADPTYGYLIKPVQPPKGPMPLVITQYGCKGFLRGGTGDEYPEHLLATAGIAAMCIKNPHVDNPKEGLRHPEQEGVFASHMALLDKLAARGDIDMGRVGITGLSSGADKTFWAISHSDRFAAAAVSGPSLDPIVAFLTGAPDNPIQVIYPIYGVPKHYLPDQMTEDETRRWNDFSAALRAGQIKTPLLMQLTDSEVLMATQLYASLIALGKPVDAWIYADELHIKRHPAHKVRVYQRNVDWFNFWLHNREDASADKVEQYRHWRSLRSPSDARRVN